MAQFATTYSSYSARGLREGLSDVIYRISPEETPFMSNAQKESHDTVYHEWQNDALATAAANAVVEGDDIASIPAATPTTRLGNYSQISRKLVLVSGTLQKANKAGRKDELAYQMSLKSAELKRDMEFIATGNQAALAGNDTTPRTTAGFESFLRTNTARGVGGVSSTLSGSTQGFPNAAPTDGTQRAFTEALLKTVHASVYTAGGNPTMLMVGVAQKQVFSTFAGIAQQRHEVGDNLASIVGGADLYVGDFGKLRAVPNRFSRNRTAFLIDPRYVSISFFRPFEVINLAKTGDAEKKAIIVEWMTKVAHEGAHGVVADLT